MRKRSSTGSLAVDLIVGMLALMPVILYAFDALTILLATSSLRTTCHNIARTAAWGRPHDLTKPHQGLILADNSGPYKRARAALAVTTAAGALRLEPSLTMSETVEGPLPIEPFGGSVRGSLSVEVHAHVTPPFLLPAIPKSLTISCRESCPYTWVMPVRANAQTFQKPGIL